MKIRALTYLGFFHNIPDVRVGDVVDVDDENGARYCLLGYAEPVTKTAEKAVGRAERAVETASHTEGVELATAGAPLDEPVHPVAKQDSDDEKPSRPRAPRRGPRKQA